MAVSVVAALKIALSILCCVFGVALVYTFTADYFASCFDPHASWWMQIEAADFFIYYFFITTWYFYKESRWIMRAVLMLLEFWLASSFLCGYMVMQLFKLSREESLKDPLHFVFTRRQKGNVKTQSGGHSVVSARVIVVAIGCFRLGLIAIAITFEGPPIRAEIFSPCMNGTLVDVSIQAVVFSLWIAYKESSWITAFLFYILLVGFGSVTLCAYIARELFYLSPEQHVSLVLFNKSNRDLMLRDPPLIDHFNV